MLYNELVVTIQERVILQRVIANHVYEIKLTNTGFLLKKYR